MTYSQNNIWRNMVSAYPRAVQDAVASLRRTGDIHARTGLTIVIAVALAHFVLWTLAAGLVDRAPPLDVVEGLVWGAEWPIGTYKLPPLPAWMLEMAWQAGRMWGVAALAAFTVAVSFPLTYLVGIRLTSPIKALAGTLLLLGIYYYSWPVPEFNHNTLQIPLWTALILVFHICLSGAKYRWWALLGVLGAAAMLAKYFAVVLLVAMLVWLLYDRAARKYVLTPRPWFALAICLLLLAPHIRWLIDHNFPPLRYAEMREARGASALRFFFTQILDMAPAILLVLGARLFIPAAQPIPTAKREEQRYLSFFAWAPLLILCAAAAVTGNRMRTMWGTPLLTLGGLYLAHFVMPKWNQARLSFIARAMAVLLVLVPFGYAMTIAVAPRFTHKAMRTDYPLPEAARQIGEAYRVAFGGSPSVIVGDKWLGGLTALGLHAPRAAGRPKVMLNGDPAISPWVKPEDLCHGVIMVWYAARKMPEAFKELSGPCPHAAPIIRTLSIPYPQFPRMPPVRLRIGLIGPGHS